MHAAETHGHGHDHGHSHAGPAPREAGVSLLRLSVVQRLGFVLVAVALIWGGVWWALS
jgi:hypothetical protein